MNINSLLNGSPAPSETIDGDADLSNILASPEELEYILPSTQKGPIVCSLFASQTDRHKIYNTTRSSYREDRVSFATNLRGGVTATTVFFPHWASLGSNGQFYPFTGLIVMKDGYPFLQAAHLPEEELIQLTTIGAANDRIKRSCQIIRGISAWGQEFVFCNFATGDGPVYGSTVPRNQLFYTRLTDGIAIMEWAGAE